MCKYEIDWYGAIVRVRIWIISDFTWKLEFLHSLLGQALLIGRVPLLWMPTHSISSCIQSLEKGPRALPRLASTSMPWYCYNCHCPQFYVQGRTNQGNWLNLWFSTYTFTLPEPSEAVHVQLWHSLPDLRTTGAHCQLASHFPVPSLSKQVANLLRQMGTHASYESQDLLYMAGGLLMTWHYSMDFGQHGQRAHV